MIQFSTLCCVLGHTGYSHVTSCHLSIILFDHPICSSNFVYFFKAEEKSDGEKSATESEKPEADSENAAPSEKKEEEEEEKAPPEDPYDNPMLVHVSYGFPVV